MTGNVSILAELDKSIVRFSERSKKLNKLSNKLSLIRLTLFFSGFILAVFLFLTSGSYQGWLTLVLFLIPFGILSKVQNKINFAHKKNDLWINIKKLHTARIKTDWNNIPYTNLSEADPAHPFDADLNISGKYSLLHLIDYSTSVQGKNRIREWLLNRIPDKETISYRHNILKELIGLRKFKDKLLLNSRLISTKALDGDEILTRIGDVQDINKIRIVLLFLLILAPINLALFLLYIFGFILPYFYLPSLVYLAAFYFNNKLISGLYDNSIELEENAGKFVPIFEFLESYDYAGNIHLKELCSSFLQYSPSLFFKRIKRIISALSIQKNPFYFILFNAFFPWDYWFALKYEYLKQDIHENAGNWLNTWYSLEALVSFAFLKSHHPENSFPVICADNIQSTGRNYVFSTENILHPLIPFDKNISNCFSLEQQGDVVIITGSNMSGKSTFLKTIGVNMALAYAGAPVTASEFKTNLFRLFTCIKISDSVTDGISYFYAEVKRLKELLNEINLVNNLPLFYLIDEIFQGTNNYERLTGSRAYIKTLSSLNGCGIISTHDLELVKLEQEIKGIYNFHFREEAVGNRMIFVYNLHNGPCPTTNALKIMEIEGLPII
jgi:hypothetical protein